MANEFIIRNGFQSRGNGQVTGSLDVTGGITGSSTGSFTGDGSGLTGLVSSSYAVTSSYALTAEAGGGTGAAVAFPWKFKEPTAAADPGSGHFRLNSVTASAITEIYVSDNTSNGIDASTLLDIIDTSTRIYLQQNDDASRALLFSVSSAPTDNTGWFTIPVTYLQGSQIPKKDKICGWILARSGSGGGTDTNFANTNLSLTGTRFHDLNGFDLTIAGGNAGIYLDEATNTSQLNLGSNYIQVDNNGIILYHGLASRVSTIAGSTVINEAGGNVDLRVESDTNPNMLLVDAGLNRVGIGKSAPNSVLDVNGDAIVSGSLKVTNVTENASITDVALYDTTTDQFFYTSSTAIGGSDTNFANTDLTFTADRNHNSAGNNFVVSADGLGVTSSNAYLGYDFTLVMGTVLTSSYLGVGDTYVQVGTGFTNTDYIQLISEGTSSMYTAGGVDGGVYFGDNVEKAMVVSTVTDNVSIGKNTSNAKLDVNGNTIITGSLTVTGTASYLKSVVSASNSGGAVTVAMTEATYPSGQVIKLNCNQGTDAIQYTLPAVTEGLHYTFTGQGTPTINDGPVRFVGPAANTITGMVACSDGNDIIHTAAARVATTTMSFADGEFRNGSKVDFVCDGTNWVVTGVHGGSTGSITLS